MAIELTFQNFWADLRQGAKYFSRVSAQLHLLAEMATEPTFENFWANLAGAAKDFSEISSRLYLLWGGYDEWAP